MGGINSKNTNKSELDKFMTISRKNLIVYNFNKKKYDSIIVNKIIHDEKTRIVSQFKENLLTNEINEFLHRFYTRSESINKLYKISKFYLDFQPYSPNYAKLNEKKIMLRHLLRKRKLQNNQGKVKSKKAKKDDSKYSTLIKPELVKNTSLTKSIINSFLIEESVSNTKTSVAMDSLLFFVDCKRNNNNLSYSTVLDFNNILSNNKIISTRKNSQDFSYSQINENCTIEKDRNCDIIRKLIVNKNSLLVRDIENKMGVKNINTLNTIFTDGNVITTDAKQITNTVESNTCQDNLLVDRVNYKVKTKNKLSDIPTKIEKKDTINNKVLRNKIVKLWSPIPVFQSQPQTQNKNKEVKREYNLNSLNSQSKLNNIKVFINANKNILNTCANLNSSHESQGQGHKKTGSFNNDKFNFNKTAINSSITKTRTVLPFSPINTNKMSKLKEFILTNSSATKMTHNPIKKCVSSSINKKVISTNISNKNIKYLNTDIYIENSLNDYNYIRKPIQEYSSYCRLNTVTSPFKLEQKSIFNLTLDFVIKNGSEMKKPNFSHNLKVFKNKNKNVNNNKPKHTNIFEESKKRDSVTKTLQKYFIK